MPRTLPLFLLLALLGPLTGCSAVAIEKPAYQTVEKHEDFELRRYAPWIEARTRVEGPRTEAGNKAFDVLFGYISGANKPRAKISMTAPVTQEAAPGKKIAMTAPVTQSAAAGEEDEQDTWHVAFIMPSEYTMQTLPEPTDPRVEIQRHPQRLIAAHRYSGNWSEERYRRHLQTLRRSLDAKGFEVLGEPVWARYNPPFTPPFLRRNEILLEVRAPASQGAESENHADGGRD